MFYFVVVREDPVTGEPPSMVLAPLDSRNLAEQGIAYLLIMIRQCVHIVFVSTGAVVNMYKLVCSSNATSLFFPFP